MNLKTTDGIFEAFNQLKVLIIGDVMIDSYIWGKVERISPEAPVPILEVKKKEKRLGGAANVAKNISALGATPILCSIIGEDLEGDHFLNLLEKRKMSKDGIIRSNSRITTVKERFISRSQQILRVDEEQVLNLSASEKQNLISRISELIRNVDAIIFEDYDKGILDEEVITATIEMANDLGKPTIVDPKKKNFNNYQNATLFKPNLKEIREGLRIDLEAGDKFSLEDAINTLKSKLKVKIALITLSEEGVYISSKTESHHIPAHKRSISDVSGAGDTVVSIAALCMSLNLPPKFTAALSNLGGGLVCEHLGVVSIDKNDLKEESNRINLQSFLT